MAKKAIVTGGSSGIGRATAIHLASAGYDIAITYATSEKKARQTAEQVEAEGAKCSIHHLDLSTPEKAEQCVDEMVARLGGLDVLISNAGMMVGQKVPTIEVETAKQIFNVNVLGATMVIQRAVHHMLPDGVEEARETPGRVVVVTSVHEVIANPNDTLYTMTKHALGGLVKCLALDLSPLNITVNAVAPGEIATPMNQMDAGEFDDTTRPAIPVRRTGHPDEVARVIAFLAGDHAGFVTGARWPIDGGLEAAAPLAVSGFRDSYMEG